jgi:chromosome segregation ATPase
VEEAAKLRESVDDLLEKLASSEEKTARLQKELAALTADPEHVEDLRAQLVADLERSKQALEVEQSSRTALEEALEESRARCVDLSDQLAARTQEAAEARSQAGEHSSRITELEGVAAKLEESEALAARIASDLQDKSEALGKALAEAEVFSKERDALRARFESEQAARMDAEKSARHADGEIARLREELAALADDTDDKSGMAAQMAVEVERLRIETELARSAREKAESALEEAISRAGRAEEEIAALGGRLAKRDDDAAAAAGLEEAQPHLVRLTADMSEISRQLERVESRAEEQARSIERLTELVEARFAEGQEPREEAVSEQRETKPAAERSAVGDEASSPDAEGLTLIPEIIDDDLSLDEGSMVDTLLRFIEPK